MLRDSYDLHDLYKIKQIPKIDILYYRYSRKNKKTTESVVFRLYSKDIHKDEISPTPLFSCFFMNISRIQDVYFRNLFYFVFSEVVCLLWFLTCIKPATSC